MKDICTSFMIYNNTYRGRFLRLNNLLKEIIEKHNYPIAITHALAEGTTLGTILASALKYDGLFTLQTQGDGPLSQVVVDVSSDGKIRACATYSAGISSIMKR